ncbi:LamG-like jellyroll fold domain-containing protein [Sediminitomix flava]|uniref:Ig-like domain-containing protein n=1 Tax=Sediminitomix flava TaxID=379075 RepID=A0A315ZEX2_SEDFL|nr:LamG-like jellyroll fold domain-containing protein [Sediminitomix flava]PWJ43710.1 Ig-like domain-containing protein [Sediminitomix flava]
MGRHFLFFYLFSLTLFSCTEKYNTQKVYDYQVRGLVQKGPYVSGSPITIQELDENFIPTGLSFNTIIQDDFGSFAIRPKISSPFIEIIAQGYYFNEVSGDLSNSSLYLRSILEVKEGTTANINILTTLTKDRIISLIEEYGYTFRDAKSQATFELLKVFDIEENTLHSFNEMDLSSTNNEAAILIAISSIIQGQNTIAQLSEFISKFSVDFKEDGKIDSELILRQIKENSETLNPSQIANNLKTRYTSLGYDIQIPKFDHYINKLIDLKVMMVYPNDQQKDLSNDTEIKIFFNKKLDPASISLNTIYLSLKNEIVSTSLSYNEKDNSITIRPLEELKSLSSYTINIKSNLKALDDTKMSDEFISQFTTVRLDIVSDLTNHYIFSGNVNDISGNNNQVILSQTSYSSDIKGDSNQALNFNGNGHYMDFNRSINPVTEDWTFSIWFKLDQLPSNKDDAFFLTSNNHSNESDIYLYVDNDDNMIKTGIASSRSKVSTNVVVSKDQWYQAAITYSSDSLSIYVNGELKSRTSNQFSSSNTTNEKFRVACNLIDSWYGYNENKGRIFGSIDNLRIYSRVLNETEIESIYNLENISSNSRISNISFVPDEITLKSRKQNSWH